jgi:hypothetical protein
MKKIWRVVLHEIRAAIPPFLFFLVFFHMLAITRAVANNEMELTALKASAATIGALLVAKSILVVESLPLARWFRRMMIINVLWRTFLFGVVVLVFRVLEEAVANHLKHEQAKSLTELAAQLLSPVALVEIGWIFIGMFGFCLIAEYCRLLGGDLVWKVMTHPRIEPHEAGERHPPRAPS